MAPITPEEYASKRILACPACGSTDLDRAPACSEPGGAMTAWIGCERCRSTWQETYTLTGYVGLTDKSGALPKGH
jgi:hypothetical protein